MFYSVTGGKKKKKMQSASVLAAFSQGLQAEVTIQGEHKPLQPTQNGQRPTWQMLQKDINTEYISHVKKKKKKASSIIFYCLSS